MTQDEIEFVRSELTVRLGQCGRAAFDEMTRIMPPSVTVTPAEWMRRIDAGWRARFETYIVGAWEVTSSMIANLSADPDGPDADTTEIPAAQPPVDYHG